MLDDGAIFAVGADPDWQPTGELRWPPPLLPSGVKVDELVLPIRTKQGILYNPDPAEPTTFSLVVHGPSTCALSMRFWSVSTPAGGLLCVLDTPTDAALDVRSGTDASVGVLWRPTLSRFDDRRPQTVMLTAPGYVAAARRYRELMIENGRSVTVADKISGRPRVAGLVGAPYFSTGYLPSLSASCARSSMVCWIWVSRPG